MRSVFVLLCVLGLANAATAKKRPKPRPKPAISNKFSAPTGAVSGRVAVLGLASLGLPEDMRHNLETLLLSSIGTVRDLKLIPPLDVKMLLQLPKNADLAVCLGGPECAQRIGRMAGADVVVFGTCAAIGDSFSLNLRALAVATGEEIGRQNVSVSGSRDQLIPEVRLATYRMLAPAQVRGALFVDIDVQGVAIAVDGKEAGITPLTSPIADLTPGEHTVLVKRLGYLPLEQKLVIRPFQTTRLKVQLQQAQP